MGISASLTKQIELGEAELARLDPKLGQLIELQKKPLVHEPRTNYFFSLCRSIVGQQLSLKAAATIFVRLEAATDIDPKKVAGLDEAAAKPIGLSKQKLGYLRDLAQHFASNPTIYDHLDKLPDDEVIAELVAIKGIGTWTAQMFLMFTLIRLDVFAPDDIGLQRAMKQLYGWNSVPGRKKLEATAAKWSPYRTIACWHLWRSLENTPI